MKQLATPLFAVALAVVTGLATASHGLGAVIVSSTFQGGAQGTYKGDPPQADWFSSATIASATLSGAGFSASGSDKLVVSIATKSDDEEGATVTGMTYDGVSLTAVGLDTTTFQRTYQNLFYLDDVASDGDLSITFDSLTEAYTVYLFALDGTASGVGNTISATAGTTTPTLTSTTDNAFLVWEVGRNVSGGNPLFLDSTSGSATYDTDLSVYGGRGKSLAVWTTGESAGDYTITVGGTNGTGGFVGAAFEAAIPEPASLAMGLAGLTLIAARRRH